jgi:hypothetical protein
VETSVEGGDNDDLPPSEVDVKHETDEMSKEEVETSNVDDGLDQFDLHATDVLDSEANIDENGIGDSNDDEEEEKEEGVKQDEQDSDDADLEAHYKSWKELAEEILKLDDQMDEAGENDDFEEGERLLGVQNLVKEEQDRLKSILQEKDPNGERFTFG